MFACLETRYLQKFLKFICSININNEHYKSLHTKRQKNGNTHHCSYSIPSRPILCICKMITFIYISNQYQTHRECAFPIIASKSDYRSSHWSPHSRSLWITTNSKQTLNQWSLSKFPQKTCTNSPRNQWWETPAKWVSEQRFRHKTHQKSSLQQREGSTERDSETMTEAIHDHHTNDMQTESMHLPP